MSKELSCGVIVRDPVTRGILACHPTGSPYKDMDIPKGHINEGERPIDCACREMFEETGFSVAPQLLLDLGRRKYTHNKDLHLFYIETDCDISKLRCSSMFENNSGVILPEINRYEKLMIDCDQWYPALKRCMKEALMEYNLYE